MSNQTIEINPLPRPEHSGDWHDKPLKWVVNGPGNEVQKFSLKKEARLYRSFRSKAKTQVDAINTYSRLTSIFN